jgi:hypothetical protein
MKKQIIPAITLFISFILSISPAFSQVKQTNHVNQAWMGYFNQTRLSDKWGFWLDLHLRTKENFFDKFSQSIIRTGATYYLNNDAKLTAGYTYVTHYPADNHPDIAQPEHRLWQQIQWHSKFPKLRLMQWFRLEERWRKKILANGDLGEGYNFNYRIRYNFLAQFPLGKKKFTTGSLSAVLNNEVHINLGKEITYNYFDQNRFFIGLNYQVNKTGNLQFGYMNLFQQLPAGNKYKANSAARLFYFHNLDLRKKKPLH